MITRSPTMIRPQGRASDIHHLCSPATAKSAGWCGRLNLCSVNDHANVTSLRDPCGVLGRMEENHPPHFRFSV